MRKKLRSLLIATALVFSFTGCSSSRVVNNQQVVENRQETNIEEYTKSEQSNTISLENIPEYNGLPYIELNGNIPEFTDEGKQNTTSFENYSELDSLGRCGVAFANVGKDIMSTEKRGKIGMIKPSGWHTVKYPEVIKDKYLWNRCHLIAFMLAGENANQKNLITGTRYLNIDGMLPFENQVADYVKETNNHVLYRVTPIFKDDELVARGVHMEAYSVEDNGSGVCFNVYVYNIQPGIIIDYATGNSSLDTTYEIDQEENRGNIENKEEVKTEERTEEIQNSNESTYILNDNTKKFHKPNCSSVKRMNEENKKEWIGEREKLIEQGYEPCGNCNP